MNYEIKNIISGKSKVRYGDTIQTIANYLRGSQKAGYSIKDTKLIKLEETEALKKFCNLNKFWINEIHLDLFVSFGAEQRVFLKNPFLVIKLNDSIYYETWLDYLNNLLLHNYFFQDTAYLLDGFFLQNDILYAVVIQNFVKSDSPTNLNHVKIFLESNGFILKKNNDYFNPNLGIILEDLHEENVLTNNGNLFFIDTVFYLV